MGRQGNAGSICDKFTTKVSVKESKYVYLPVIKMCVYIKYGSKDERENVH